ncbi:hypothetical protein FRC10_010364 [Ceratobasidium sp. 414]|nr:hypothetical protein FRC10_010364 [Ceratobasidium sp. 414]
MSTSSSPKASSTFWLIETTSVSDTFTTTATFTLWVPLYTTSTTPTAMPSATASAVGQTTAARSQTGIIVGSVVGCAVLAALAVLFCFICRMRRARPQFRLHQTDSSKAPDANQSGNSMHALLDLTAEPDPHPSNIEPWVAQTAVRRTGKIQPRADPTELETGDQELLGPPPIVESLQVAEPSHHEPELPPPRLAGRTLQLAQHDNIASSSAAPTRYNPKSERPPSRARRRRNQRDPSPPRLEEDAGVSLMRAGDDVALTRADEPPAYNFASGPTL